MFGMMCVSFSFLAFAIFLRIVYCTCEFTDFQIYIFRCINYYYIIYIYFNTDRITSSFVVDVYNNKNAVKFICKHKYALEAKTVQRIKYVK